MLTRHRSSRSSRWAALLSLALVGFATTARADDDALAPYRDRFRIGMEKYKAGGVAEAIRVWSAIYDEIGPKRGYRLAFDLARAYDSNGEATRAAERYRSFLDEVTARRGAGEPLEALVEHEAQDAEDRVVALNLEHGRIEVDAAPSTTLAQVDDTDPRLGTFTAYVAPGRHVVTFNAGRVDAEKLEVTVAAGELVVAHARAPATPVPEPTPAPAPKRTQRETKRPFSSVVLYAGAAATAVSVVAPALAYGHASSLANTYNASGAGTATKAAAFSEYPGARTLAYAMLAVPVTLGVVTGGLTTWYFAGGQEREVTVSLEVGPLVGGAGGVLVGSF
jgi:hypothetical protein